MRLLRVDMNQRQVCWDAIPAAYERLGGRALIARILLDEIPATCQPLGAENKLIFAPGLLGGANITAAGRLSVGGKSPLTNGVKEANAGGTAGECLGKLGIKAVIIEGQASEGEWFILHIQSDKAILLPADDLHGKGTYATSAQLQQHFGKDATIISIGPAGEYQLRGAAVVVTGEGDQRSNIAARGGLGAVMGSKGLKAVVIDRPIKREFEYANEDLLRTAAKAFTLKLINDPKLGTKGSQHLYGTASIVAAVNEIGSLPTRNFSSGNFEHASTLYGEILRETTLARGGQAGTRCMPGCVIACRNVFMDKDGNPIVGTLQFETIALIGSNLGLGSLDEIARLNYLCNDIGLDTIETGAALGVAAEAGLAQFGDFVSFASLLKQVVENTPHGRMIGNGVVETGKLTGITHVPAALGQAFPGYDPRSLKGNGVTYATSPQGADHTAGNAFGARKEVNPLGKEGQRELSLKLQIIAAMLDSTGLCLFARPPIIAEPQLMVDMLNGMYGWNWAIEDYNQFNRNVLRMELEFNRKAGITASDYRLPEYLHTDPLPPHNAVFDVPDEELDRVFDDL